MADNCVKNICKILLWSLSDRQNLQEIEKRVLQARRDRRYLLQSAARIEKMGYKRATKELLAIVRDIESALLEAGYDIQSN
jgi:hypothetical protein